MNKPKMLSILYVVLIFIQIVLFIIHFKMDGDLDELQKRLDSYQKELSHPVADSNYSLYYSEGYDLPDGVTIDSARIIWKQ